MIDSLFTIGLGICFLASLAAAVDAIRYSPREWDAASHSQKLRLGVFVSPILSFLCLPAGIGIALYYGFKVRPNLVNRRRRFAANGVRPPERRVVGFGATWRELSPWNKVRVVIAAIAAVALEIAVWKPSGTTDDVPLWGKILLLPITFVAFFIAAYLALWFAQIFLPLAWKAPDNVTPTLNRMRHSQYQEQKRIAEERRRRRSGY